MKYSENPANAPEPTTSALPNAVGATLIVVPVEAPAAVALAESTGTLAMPPAMMPAARTLRRCLADDPIPRLSTCDLMLPVPLSLLRRSSPTVSTNVATRERRVDGVSARRGWVPAPVSSDGSHPHAHGDCALWRRVGKTAPCLRREHRNWDS